MIFAFIEAHLAEAYPVEVSCEVLEVSRSGYYAWLERPTSARAVRREELAAQVEAAHAENRGVYGSPRVQKALEAAGVDACVNTVADIMKERDIRAKAKRPFVPRTTHSRHGRPAVKNVLDRQFDAELPNKNGWSTSRASPPVRGGCIWRA